MKQMYSLFNRAGGVLVTEAAADTRRRTRAVTMAGKESPMKKSNGRNKPSIGVQETKTLWKLVI